MAMVPDGWQDFPIEIGMIVEMHSLSRTDMNGRLGECCSWDPIKERWGVRVLGGPVGSNSLAVRPENLRRAQPASRDVVGKAINIVDEAFAVLSALREGKGNAAQAFSQAEELFKKADELDPTLALLHQARGDAAHMRGDFVSQAMHARRAVANGHALRGDDGFNHQNTRRMALASALGNAGDLEGELEQVRLVLKSEPGNIHARLTLGQSLIDRGELESAVPELLMALQLPPDAKPPWPSFPTHQLQMFRDVARDRLCTALALRAQELAARGDHRAAADMIGRRVLTVPGVSDEMAARAGSKMATSLCALGETEAAEAALTHARNASERGVSTLCRAFVLTTSGHCKEMLADAWRGGRSELDETGAALYEEAKAFYSAANALCEDAASREGYMRVQAKESPDWEWVATPSAVSVSLGSLLGGSARVLKPGGVTLEVLPRGPAVR